MRVTALVLYANSWLLLRITIYVEKKSILDTAYNLKTKFCF